MHLSLSLMARGLYGSAVTAMLLLLLLLSTATCLGCLVLPVLRAGLPDPVGLYSETFTCTNIVSGLLAWRSLLSLGVNFVVSGLSVRTPLMQRQLSWQELHACPHANRCPCAFHIPVHYLYGNVWE